MVRTRTRRSSPILPAMALLAVALLAAGCGSSSDPGSWEEAEQGGFAVRTNFLDSCQLANTEDAGSNTLGEAAARSYCRCSFNGLRASLTLDEFDAIDDALRDQPEPSRLDEADRDIWDTVSDIIEACEADL